MDTNAFAKCTSLTEVHIPDLESWCGISFAYASSSVPYSHPFNACTGSLYLNSEKLTQSVRHDGVYPHTMTTRLWGGCIEFGMQECDLCGATKTLEKKDASHTLAWTVVFAPTQYKAGDVKIYCQYNDFSTFAALPKLTDAGYACQVLQAATCTQEGLGRYRLYLSEWDLAVELEAAIPALGHSDTAVITPPTCTEDGFTTYTCTVCGETSMAEEVPASGHTMVTDPRVEPDCTQPGLTDGVQCDRCGLILRAQEEIPPMEHSWDSGTVTLEPTEETQGLHLYTCILCGQKREEVIPTLDHVHSYEELYTAPTCTAEGFVTMVCPCGHSYIAQILLMLPHSIAEQGRTDPTCTQPG